MVSDAQKYFFLKLKKGLLIDGMYKYTRNPNYLGEIMIYGGLAIFLGNKLIYLMLIFIWTFIFGLNMISKD